MTNDVYNKRVGAAYVWLVMSTIQRTGAECMRG